MLHMVSKEKNLQADVAPPQLTPICTLLDYRMMRKKHRRKCLDVCLKRGANCNTDHSMVRAKFIVGQSARSFRSVSGRAGVKRWNVTKLQGDCKDDRGTVTAKGRFLESARKGLKGKWDTGISVPE